MFTGDVDVALLTNDTSNTYDVGHVVNPTSVGPVDVAVTFRSAAVSPTDFTRILGGNFKVVIRGPAATSFVGQGAEANLQLTFTFAAFEQDRPSVFELSDGAAPAVPVPSNQDLRGRILE